MPRLIADPDNSDDEDRFIILGLSERTRLLVVCHCYREMLISLEARAGRKVHLELAA